MSTIYKNLVIMFEMLTGWALAPVRVSITNKVPAFKQGMLDIRSRLDLINALSQMLNITGIAQDKEQAKSFMCQVLMSITKPVKSFSITIKNNTLKEQVKTPISKYMKMRPGKLVQEAQKIHNLVVSMLPELQAAGITITDNDMSILQDSITRFTNLSNSPETAIKDRKSINISINTYVKEANAICHDVLDENIVLFKDDALYRQEYKIKRHVNQLGMHHTRLDATVVNELGVPYPYCTVTVDSFTKKSKTYKAVSAFADANGKVTISKFEEGMRTVTISCDGVLIKKEFGPFNFESGKEVAEVFVCEPAFSNIPAPQQQQNQNA